MPAPLLCKLAQFLARRIFEHHFFDKVSFTSTAVTDSDGNCDEKFRPATSRAERWHSREETLR
jgi:hypothetical protein